MISLNKECIGALASTLQEISLPADFRQRFVPALECDAETAFLALCSVAAICHSTKGGLKGIANGREVRGTEYLLAAFCGAANHDPASLALSALKIIDESGLRALLSRFIDAPTISLPDLSRRAEILRELATEIERFLDGRLATLLERAQGRVGGPDGFYEGMDQLSAFHDPLKKKSGVFLYFLEVTGRLHVIDTENLLPMIDYHVIRLLCRTGCIEIQSEALRHKLMTKEEATPEEERILREAAFKIRQELGKIFDVPERGELLYLLSRSYCRHAPVCVPGTIPESDSFDLYTGTVFNGQCPFQKWCPGACHADYRDLWEPIVHTENY